jgi:hypothetical protein
MKRSTVVRTSSIGALCALAGGAAGIAGTSASSSTPHQLTVRHRGHGLFFMLGARPLANTAGPPVHADAVVPNKSGGFDTVTLDRGSFSSLSADQLTLVEGTKTATYKTVTLTIPAGATIRRNGAQAQLTDLKAGDEVIVINGPKDTMVIAHDAQHAPKFMLDAVGRGDRPPMPPAGLPSGPVVPDEGSTSGS